MPDCDYIVLNTLTKTHNALLRSEVSCRSAACSCHCSACEMASSSLIAESTQSAGCSYYHRISCELRQPLPQCVWHTTAWLLPGRTQHTACNCTYGTLRIQLLLPYRTGLVLLLPSALIKLLLHSTTPRRHSQCWNDEASDAMALRLHMHQSCLRDAAAQHGVTSLLATLTRTPDQAASLRWQR